MGFGKNYGGDAEMERKEYYEAGSWNRQMGENGGYEAGKERKVDWV